MAAAAAGAAAAARASPGAALALAGVVGRWPGGCGDESTRLQLQRACGDALSSVPASRWVLELSVDVRALSDAQVACAGHGGFVAGAERFSGRAFSVSPAEAAAMDPQQRLLLEHGYEALHGAARRRVSLMGDDTAVSLGIERPDWALAQPLPARQSVYAVTGDNVSVAAGRLCFVLGLQGACSSVDTACASALVAVHGAAHLVHGVESGGALALSVSLKLVPHGTLGAALAGMLSTDGRCKTLDARANGYARSEAVGALVLQACSGGGALEPSLGGSAVRQDGRSASLTAPNGSAQRTLLLCALSGASTAPGEVVCAEAHGTGTVLGDPTETGSLAASLGGAERGAVAVGAAKASVGHSEAGSGHVGLLRAAALAGREEAVGNAQLRVLNGLVAARLGSVGGVPFMCATQGLSGEAVAGAGARGVSSFGYSGTIAHAVLTAARPVERTLTCRPADGPMTSLVFTRNTFPWRDQPRLPVGSTHTVQLTSEEQHTRAYSSCWSSAPLADASASGACVLLASRAALPSWVDVSPLPTASSCAAAALLTGATAAAASLRGVHAAVALAQQLPARQELVHVRLLTRGALASAVAHAATGAAHGGVWGVARVLRLEHPALHVLSEDVAHGTHVLALPTSSSAEGEVAWRADARSGR